MSDPKVIRVRIDYDDGTYRELNERAGCEQWSEMVSGQAAMAFVHGMRCEPLPWVGTAEGCEPPRTTSEEGRGDDAAS